MTARNTQSERLARLEIEQTHQKERLDKGDNIFEKIKKMIDDLRDELKTEIDEIKAQISELKPIADLLRNKWLLGLIALSLVFTGVGLTLSFLLGVDVTTQISEIRNITK